MSSRRESSEEEAQSVPNGLRQLHEGISSICFSTSQNPGVAGQGSVSFSSTTVSVSSDGTRTVTSSGGGQHFVATGGGTQHFVTLGGMMIVTSNGSIHIGSGGQRNHPGAYGTSSPNTAEASSSPPARENGPSANAGAWPQISFVENTVDATSTMDCQVGTHVYRTGAGRQTASGYEGSEDEGQGDPARSG